LECFHKSERHKIDNCSIYILFQKYNYFAKLIRKREDEKNTRCKYFVIVMRSFIWFEIVKYFTARGLRSCLEIFAICDYSLCDLLPRYIRHTLQLWDLVRINRFSRRFSLSRLSLDSIRHLYRLRDINTLKFISLTIYLKLIFVLLSSHIIYTLRDINNLKFICLTIYLKFIFVFLSFLFSSNNKLCQRGEYI